ncbi:MAG: FAD-dependent oxidoreductase [Wenzhouxiangella sp.]
MTESIAVIGSGISGLTAAHAGRQAGWKVTLFEQQATHGMAAHALSVDGGVVDVPLRIMGDGSWQSVLNLARELDVDTFPVDVYTSCSWCNRKTWFRSSRMPLTQWPMVGSWRFLNRRSLRLGRGLLQLAALHRQLQSEGHDPTLGRLIEANSFDPLFWRGLILPILKTICTCDEAHLLRWPARQLLALLHGILHSDKLMRLRGGTGALASALARDLPSHNGSPVASVRLNRKSISVRNQRGEGGRFDRVIVATQANQLGFLGGGTFEQERQILEGVGYAQGELVIHRDPRFMPINPRDWTALNFQMDDALEQSMFTVWVNAVEPTLANKAPVFQTWNPLNEPQSDLIVARIPMQRAVVTTRTAGILRQIRRWHAQPGRRLFYCGSWAVDGVPLLETGVQSAHAVVDEIKKQAG